MAEAVAPQVFTRRASGLVRVMSPYSAFIYNVLTMGLIFPWTYVWAPTAFQGSNFVLGILFAFLFELPIALAYVWLATALPRSGGDYVFQSRVFGGGFGFTVVFAFFVVWILQWVALSGWLMAVLGIAPTFFGLGVRRRASALIDVGTWAATARTDHHHQHPERGCHAGAARDRVPQLRPVPVRDVVRDPRLVRRSILILFFTNERRRVPSGSWTGSRRATTATGFFATARTAAADAGVNFTRRSGSSGR